MSANIASSSPPLEKRTLCSRTLLSRIFPPNSSFPPQTLACAYHDAFYLSVPDYYWMYIFRPILRWHEITETWSPFGCRVGRGWPQVNRRVEFNRRRRLRLQFNMSILAFKGIALT